jgi:2-polyprenyl-3-methyl-5-hydroxy-6-metoxy-1,4-benzoquinol methylase
MPNEGSLSRLFKQMNMEFQRFTDEKRLMFIAAALDSSIPKGAQVMDIGCGNGVITRRLGSMGFNVLGVDVSEKAITKARSLNTYPNVSFQVKSAEELVAGGEKYKAIVCSEVLEHLHHPDQLLKVIRQILDKDGILIVTVPNGRGAREIFVTRPFQYLMHQWPGIWKVLGAVKSVLGYSGTTVQSDADDLSHIQFFNQQSLSQLANTTKFNIHYWGKTNFIEDVFPFSLVTKRIRGLQKLDCKLAEHLPLGMTGGFLTIWK